MIRWLSFLFVRHALGIPRGVSNRDVLLIGLACAHCGHFKVVSIIEELKRQDRVVTWAAVREFVPEVTAAFVESKLQKMEN